MEGRENAGVSWTGRTNEGEGWRGRRTRTRRRSFFLPPSFKPLNWKKKLTYPDPVPAAYNTNNQTQTKVRSRSRLSRATRVRTEGGGRSKGKDSPNSPRKNQQLHLCLTPPTQTNKRVSSPSQTPPSPLKTTLPRTHECSKTHRPAQLLAALAASSLQERAPAPY